MFISWSKRLSISLVLLLPPILCFGIAQAQDSEYIRVNCRNHPRVDLSKIQEVEIESMTVRIKIRTEGGSIRSTYATCQDLKKAKKERLRLLRAWRNYYAIRDYDFCYPKYYDEKF